MSKLTYTKIKRLERKAGAYEVADGNGLAIRVLASGRKSFVFGFATQLGQAKGEALDQPANSLGDPLDAELQHERQRGVEPIDHAAGLGGYVAHDSAA